MKKYVILLVLLSFKLAAQPDTEVYLGTISAPDASIQFSEFSNISQNEGYDNQPSFPDNSSLLYAATRNGQTDILIYHLKTAKKKWLTDSPDASEYSPLQIPSKNAVSAIRLDKDGNQQLYSYQRLSGKSDVIVEGFKVGYHLWFSPVIIVASVLTDDRMDLVVINTRNKSSFVAGKNVGRSLHKIPRSGLISYISKQKEGLILKSLDPLSGTTKVIMNMPAGSEDMIWMADGAVLSAIGNTIVRNHPEEEGQWKLLHRFNAMEISNLSRMAISPDQKYLAIVADTSPGSIVQKQLNSFNEARLDAFVSCFSDDVLVKNFPADTLFVGSAKMRDNYGRFMDRQADAKVELTNRIILGNMVIDAETAYQNGKSSRQAAIYELENERIISMAFLHEKSNPLPAEKIVQQQLDAYNKRDIDAFMDTYSEDVQLNTFPDELISQGKETMRLSYNQYFSATPDLNCSIGNRIVLGNTVIDEEFITANGKTFRAVAIYEVENDKIAKVTFLR